MKHQDLSRLLSGDLPVEEARALHGEIARDPALAAAWAQMQSLAEELDALPLDKTPPPLPDSVYAVGTAPSSARPWVPWLALAAALCLLVLWPAPPSHQVLTAGEAWVQGEIRVLAADLAVDVDGTARISVEPSPLLGREEEHPPEIPMDKTSILAAAAGSLVTVAVLQGSALIHGPEGDTTAIAAGQTASVSSQPSRADHPRGALSTPDRSTTPSATAIAQLEEELRQTKAALRTAQIAGAVTRGQLAARTGEVSEWPSDVPASMSPEGFEQDLQGLLLEGESIAQVDCTEFPCVAAIRLSEPESGAETIERIKVWAKERFGGESLSMSASRASFGNEDNPTHLLVFGAHDGDRNDNAGVRTDTRIDMLMDDLQQD